MKYTLEDEYKLFEQEPSLTKFRERAYSKPNGAFSYDSYMNLRVNIKNDQDVLDKMDTDSTSYNAVQKAIERKKAYLGAMELELGAPLKTLEKIDNAKSVLQTDWWDKTVDVVRGFLSNPKDDGEPPQESQKPSLWDVFWK